MKTKVLVLLLGGAFMMTAVGADSCSEDLKDASGDNDAKYDKKVKQVPLGASVADMKSVMGQPRDRPQVTEAAGYNTRTYYYGDYQFSFECASKSTSSCKLESKNRY